MNESDLGLPSYLTFEFYQSGIGSMNSQNHYWTYLKSAQSTGLIIFVLTVALLSSLDHELENYNTDQNAFQLQKRDFPLHFHKHDVYFIFGTIFVVLKYRKLQTFLTIREAPPHANSADSENL